MEDTHYLFNVFLNDLFKYLLEKHPFEHDLSIFRKHSNKLDANGDVSFPLISFAWQEYTKIQSSHVRIPLLEFTDIPIQKTGIEKLINVSKNWNIPITKCLIENESKLNVFLDRVPTFHQTISHILANDYGSSMKVTNTQLEVRTEFNETDLSVMNLTQLRINLLKDVAENLLKVNNCGKDEDIVPEIVYLTHKSQSKIDKTILCGVVTSKKLGKMNIAVTAEEFYRQRTVDMRLMAQHKYGVRVNSESGWQEFFEKLGSAAVTFDLLHGKPSKSLVININNPTSSSSKGASFILYNFARIAEIFKQFEKKVASGIYPPLPDIDKVDFALLNQSEEWEILYVYLMPYPQVIKTCVKDLFEYKLNVYNICLFLDSLCSLFSVYYRRVRILTEARTYLIPVLHSRIYLLKAIQLVLHDALLLLNIPPVKQM